MTEKEKRAKVAIVNWPKLEEVDQALEEALALLGGLERFIKPGQYVLVKPNLTAGGPSSSGGTTHVELVEALVQRIAALRPSRIVVAEGTVAPKGMETIFRGLGYTAALEKYSVEFIDLDASEHRPMPLQDPVYPGTLALAQPILDCDVYITVPCLKNHYGAGITVAIKNAYGLIPLTARRDIHREYRVEHAIVDINRIRPPDLIIVDGFEGAQGMAGGADFTRPAGARLLLASEDCVALDRVAADIMQQNPWIQHIEWAGQKGLGLDDLAHIEVVGLSLEKARRNFTTPEEVLAEQMEGLRILDLGSCTGCRSSVASSLFRYQMMRLARPLTIVLGKEGEMPGVREGELLFVGDCTADLPRPAGATFLPGCPTGTVELDRFYREKGLLCERCHGVLREALASCKDGELLAAIRALSGGEEVYLGEKNTRQDYDLTLLVGDCMGHYYGNIASRAMAAYGLDRVDHIAFVAGCPPSLPEVLGALASLKEVSAARVTRPAPAAKS